MSKARRLSRTAQLLAGGALGLALIAAPVGFDANGLSLDRQVAVAKNNGNGGQGNGHGGPGGNHGRSADAGQAKGHDKTNAVAAAGLDAEVEDGGVGNGHAKGQGLGHAKHGDISGVSAQAGGTGLSAASLDALGDLEGNLNAAHASAMAMANAAPNSMPGKIAAAVAASYTGDPALDESGFIDADEIDDEALASELGKISNKATIDSASGEPTVDQGVVDAVKGLVDGKVSVDAIEPAAATDGEDGA